MLRTLAVSLFLLSATITGAEAQKIGDWVMGTDLTLDERASYATARTPGSRTGTELLIERCEAYEVTFLLTDDPQFGADELPDVPGLVNHPGATKMIFGQYAGHHNFQGSSNSEPIIISAGDTRWYLQLHSIRGALMNTSLRFCPTTDLSDNRCLRFSLVGFNEALRRGCASQRPIWSKR